MKKFQCKRARYSRHGQASAAAEVLLHRDMRRLKSTQKAILYRIALSSTLMVPISGVSYAQQTSGQLPTPLNAGGAAPSGGLVPSASPPIGGSAAVPADPYARYEWKGINVNLAPPPATVERGLFGARQALQDHGIGFFGYSLNAVTSNVLHSTKAIGGRQVYNGQQTTGFTNSFVGLTYDLSQYGIPDGQLVASADYLSTSWNGLGPNSFKVDVLSYYQTAFKKRLEFKIGLFYNSLEFVGPNIAGNLSGAIFGSSGNLFTQIGQSGASWPSYGVNVTAHLTDHWYDKFGLARAVNPNGVLVEQNHNPTGLTWSTPNTGAYVIDELGYLRPSAPGTPRIWVRGGGVYSGSSFTDYNNVGRRAKGNYAMYLLADRQIWQQSSLPAEAFRGVYVGFSAEYEPPSLSRFSQYYEARIYGLGLIPGRIRDQTSLVFTNSIFSSDLVSSARRSRQLAHDDSKSVTASYSALLIHGVYLNAAVSYVNNPSAVTYTSNTGSALNLTTGFSFYF